MTAPRPVSVLQVVGSLGMGGAETWLMEVLRLWSKTGAGRMEFLVTSGNRGVFDDEANGLGATIHYVPYHRANLPAFVKQFRRILREGRYDAIHDHSDYASGWHFLMGTGVLPPVRIAHVHNTWIHIAEYYGVTAARRSTAKLGKGLVRVLATDVCGTSREVLQDYGFENRASRRLRVSVAHCGIDVARFNVPRGPDRQSVRREFGWSDGTKLVLFVGRLDEALELDHPRNIKNSWFALNLVRAALDKDSSVRLLMAGAGDAPRRELERHIAAWGLSDQIRLLGVRTDVPRLMRAADVLLFPSRQEGLGMVAVEAQAACLPVLASSSVPRECVVIPELYDSLPLTEPIERWAEALLRRIVAPRPSLDACRRAFEPSPFTIENSARRLQEIYTAS